VQTPESLAARNDGGAPIGVAVAEDGIHLAPHDHSESIWHIPFSAP
jgi:hypothetical protein